MYSNLTYFMKKEPLSDFGDLFHKLPFLRLPRFVVLWILQRNTFSSNLYRVYVYLLYHANFVDGVMYVQGGVYDCKKGEVVANRGQIAELLGLERSVVSVCVTELERTGLVVSHSVGRLTCFEVCNYALLVAGAPREGRRPDGGAAVPDCSRYGEREPRRADDE